MIARPPRHATVLGPSPSATLGTLRIRVRVAHLLLRILTSVGSVLASESLVALACVLSWPALIAAQPATSRVSVSSGGGQGTNHSTSSAVSADGRFIAFNSEAPDLVANDTNGAQDVFVHDRQTGTTSRVSIGPGGVQGDFWSGGGDLSADGRWVAFVSAANNLVPDD